ncbi:hypothetical protein MMC06_003712 [Schaereria dolodes]|nr:hypothetical protein [Schaereria dolodes]
MEKTFPTAANTPPYPPYPIGISCSPSHLTAAEVAEGNHVAPVVRVEGDDAYKRAQLQILHREPYLCVDGTGLVDAFTNALRTLKIAAQKQLRRRLTDALIVLPLSFNSVSSSIVRTAATAAGFNVEYPKGDSQGHSERGIFSFRKAINMAYTQGRCSVDASTAKQYNGHFVLSIDYNRGSLGLSVLEVNGDLSGKVLLHATHAALGEANISVEHDRSLADAVRLNIECMLVGGLRPNQPWFFWTPLRAQIRAVILSGDASPEGFAALRALLRDHFADVGDGSFEDHVDENLLLACGTAYAASLLVEQDRKKDVVRSDENCSRLDRGYDVFARTWMNA